MSDPPRGGLSLYDNLLDPNAQGNSSATISSAPVLYNQGDTPAGAAVSSGAKKPIDPALRFQPIRRPQAKQPAKPKPSFPKAITKPATDATTTTTVAPAPTSADSTSATTPAAPVKSTLADWAAADDDEYYYVAGEKRQRGGRRKKKRKQEREFVTDWNDIYDPTRPTNVDEYLKSDERISEVREWKALLYKHRKRPDLSDGSDEEDEPPSHARSNQFAPPSNYNFAPPPPPPQSPPAPPPDDKSGDDAYARRLALSQGQDLTPPLPPPPPPPPEDSAPPRPPNDSTTISRAPIRYTQSTAEDQVNDEDDDYDDRPHGLGSSSTEHPPPDTESRSSRPGQAGFATRLMNKYGWSKGSGLGADESGIVNPLRVQVEKRRKKADADGGGWAEPGGKGKIIGSRRRGGDTGKFGVMSDVIVLRNMLENMPNLEEEISHNLQQEIGEECGNKYGRVERLHIDVERRLVFIKFTDQVSALRAVNELDGRVFNGNHIVPKFYDTETFDQGIYR